MSKIIALTGTSSGIGQAIVRKFRKEKWDVVTLPRYILDVRNVEAIFRLNFGEHDNQLDVFINAAGIMLLKDFPDTTLEDWNNTIDTNLRSVFFLCQKMIPLIKDKGHLINISSVAGIFPEREFMAYNVSKAGVTMLTQCLSKRYGDRIFVNSISPGFVDTKLTQENRETVEDTPQHLIDDIPMKRQATPEEVADLVWFVVNSKYFNGSDIKFDGGLSTKYFGP